MRRSKISHSKMKAILFALSYFVLILSVFSNVAYADDNSFDGQISVSVPTETPIAWTMNGSFVGPSNWSIKNTGDYPFAITNISASDMKMKSGTSANLATGLKASLKTANGQKNGSLSWSNSSGFVQSPKQQAAGDQLVFPVGSDYSWYWAGGATSTMLDDSVVANVANGAKLCDVTYAIRGIIPLTGDVKITCYNSGNTSCLEAGLANTNIQSAPLYQWYEVLSDGTLSELLGETSASLNFTSSRIGKTFKCKVTDSSYWRSGEVYSDPYTFSNTFAVYSSDDESLSFYDQANVPVIGSTFDGKTVTELYYGFDDVAYDSSSLVPWSLHKNTIKSVSVVDNGIAPISTRFWFSGFRNMESCDLSKLDTSSVTDMAFMFENCSKIESLNVLNFVTSKVSNMSYMFYDCSSLTSLDLSSFDTSAAKKTIQMFDYCTHLEKITLGSKFSWYGAAGYLPNQSSEDIPGADGKWHAESDNSSYMPRDVPSNKSDTYYAVPITSFAVYSADDNSLDFYHRRDIPVIGSTFNQKVTTAVYSGIDSDWYNAETQPWHEYANKITSSVVVDNGVAPISTQYWFNGLTNLTSVDLARLDCAHVGSMNSMFGNCSSIASLDLSGLNTTNVTDFGLMFRDCSLLSSIDLDGFSTESAQRTNDMFSGCSSVQSLDLSKWLTGSVTTFSGMFYNCSSLMSIGDVSGWDTSKVESFESMFSGCRALESLASISSWDTSNVTNLGGTFRYCSSLIELPIANWDVSRSKYMQYMLQDCSSLESVDLSKWNPSSCNWTFWMFAGCSSLTSVGDISGWNVSNITHPDHMFYADTSLVHVGDLSGWDTSSMVTLESIFNECVSLPSIGDISAWNVSKVENMSTVLRNCAKLDGIGTLADWNTSAVTRTDGMFAGCEMITSLNLTKWDMSHVTDMNSMFFNCASITSFGDLTEWNTSACTNMEGLFNACISLQSLDVSGLDTSNVTIADRMFRSCYVLTEINGLNTLDMSNVSDFTMMFANDYALKSISGVPEWDMSSATVITEMFKDCQQLSSIDLSKWNTSNLRIMHGIFSDSRPENITDKKLQTINLSGWSTSNVTDMSGAFSGQNKLKTIYVGESWAINSVSSSEDMFFACDSIVGQSGITYNSSKIDATMANYETGYLTFIDPSAVAFAVYSDDDKSLNFYKRNNVPGVGDSFDGKAVTAVYTNVENGSIPWMESATDTKTVKVVDNGIKPKSAAMFFYGLKSLVSADVSKFDMSICTTTQGMFMGCFSLTDVSMENWDTKKLTAIDSMFEYCRAIKSINLSHLNLSSVTSADDVFRGAYHLQQITVGNNISSVAINMFSSIELANYVSGYSSKWYALSDGSSYAPNAIPGDKADTYFATKSLRDAAAGTSDDELQEESTIAVLLGNSESSNNVMNIDSDSTQEKANADDSRKGSNTTNEGNKKNNNSNTEENIPEVVPSNNTKNDSDEESNEKEDTKTENTHHESDTNSLLGIKNENTINK